MEFHISYSFQEKKTDTIAVTPTNKPYHNKENELVLRPSGHGALLHNLNEIDADIIFIKNIDNVVCEQYVEELVSYKKLLAGKLLYLQEKIYKYSEMCEKDELSKEELSQIQTFLFKELNIKNAPSDCIHFSYLLNRPLRICGVVRNTGAPGGGPFWVKDDYGNVTLQIVEAVQIDTTNEHQRNSLKEATHFNPVDIVCSIKDRHGKKYDLQKFCDVNAGFISEKSENGNPIKALELPGLWNGAMAKWNTALIEVPLSTFNPVKTVNDLLQIEHRPNA